MNTTSVRLLCWAIYFHVEKKNTVAFVANSPLFSHLFESLLVWPLKVAGTGVFGQACFCKDLYGTKLRLIQVSPFLLPLTVLVCAKHVIFAKEVLTPVLICLLMSVILAYASRVILQTGVWTLSLYQQQYSTHHTSGTHQLILWDISHHRTIKLASLLILFILLNIL